MTTKPALLLPALLASALLFLAARPAFADPQLTSWVTEYSTKYARIYNSDADRLNGVTKTTWTSRTGQISQSLPAYAGIQKITASDNWLYLTTSSLAPYTMGPWYDDATRSLQFINLPKNQNLSYRIPRTATLTTPPATKTTTQGMEDTIGLLVDGVTMFDPTDGYSYANGAEASPGTGQWHRDAYVNEGITFDPGNTHQQNTGKYHNHAAPIALRSLLGDHVAYDASTKTYAEMNTAPTQHSPILGWIRDGLPIYGPYGYSSPLDPASGVRRMVSGFVLRDGQTPGVDNLTATGRTALPAWSTRNNGGIAASGPAVSTTYPLGRYCEDKAYLGDLTKSGTTKYQQGTDFDLNEYNVRFCVTPEFPNGTYAYFTTLNAAGAPTYPYNVNRWFFGNATGGTATAAETVTTFFVGGASATEALEMKKVDAATGDVTITWSSVEGGTYKVEATSDLPAGSWTALTTTQAAATNAVETPYTETAGSAGHASRFYRIQRTALATYDTGTTTGTGGNEGISSVNPASGSRGASNLVLTITLNSAYNPAPPPNNVQPTSVTLTRTGATLIQASAYSRNTTTGVVSATFSIPAGATPGAYTLNATFGPNTWSLTNGFTVN